ncbi:hypothetical protein GQX73_g9071 [Xylaria multiplex]|uniref:Uncharacterized protein n=1 Tax=Xylaria multiplex TaxID=323545 RepID=A0A7C8MKA6_9PEZI|nr:hypothetical protein GQX73_g9071 [Xylaria multiplex]
MIKQNALYATRDCMAVTQNPANAIATFIVPGESDAVQGVVKAVYDDLKDGNKDANIDFREAAAQYIRVDAPTEKDALTLIRAAQRIAAIHLSETFTETRMLFVEPPPGWETNFQIDVTGGCLRMESLPGPNPVPGFSSDRYKQGISKALCEALEDASGLHSSLILKINLGCYLLHNYQPGKFTLEKFENMVKSPRASGRLETTLRHLSIETIMQLIQATNSPCIPIDNQTPTPADVVPSYVLESWHDGNRYETELEIIKKKQDGTNMPLFFNLARTIMVPESAQAPRFEATSISIGRNLGWEMVAMPGDGRVRASPAVQQYLKLGQATFTGQSSEFRAYPSVRLPQKYSLAEKFKSVTIKSIYRYSWKGTGYVVQFTINRRWQSIRDMNHKAPMSTDFDVSIYGDNWDQDSRVQAGETVGKIWGDDLRGLLPNEATDAARSALSRVEGLLGTILEIRDFFESASCV